MTQTQTQAVAGRTEISEMKATHKGSHEIRGRVVARSLDCGVEAPDEATVS